MNELQLLTKALTAAGLDKDPVVYAATLKLRTRLEILSRLADPRVTPFYRVALDRFALDQDGDLCSERFPGNVWVVVKKVENDIFMLVASPDPRVRGMKMAASAAGNASTMQGEVVEPKRADSADLIFEGKLGSITDFTSLGWPIVVEATFVTD